MVERGLFFKHHKIKTINDKRIKGFKGKYEYLQYYGNKMESNSDNLELNQDELIMQQQRQIEKEVSKHD